MAKRVAGNTIKTKAQEIVRITVFSAAGKGPAATGGGKFFSQLNEIIAEALITSKDGASWEEAIKALLDVTAAYWACVKNICTTVAQHLMCTRQQHTVRHINRTNHTRGLLGSGLHHMFRIKSQDSYLCGIGLWPGASESSKFSEGHTDTTKTTKEDCGTCGTSKMTSHAS
ncbi:Hypothetical protein, putative [Bodo saltans]|uniref:Uncharacterized protein n=1 Tax=Bodo saltans TaxID=75058 RepID=A0A0S4J514_BODSA|nr:Hypothetical protein, putative [Bodo saltans]|eukprot:CUG86552.1 Hypothetical protein, putative [Bodo saltans]